MKVAVVMMLLVAYLQAGAGNEDEKKLMCFVCSDTADTDCSTVNSNLKECPSTANKSCSKTFIEGKTNKDPEIKRACSDSDPKGCVKDTKLCTCGSSECNSGLTVTPSSTLALTLVLAAGRGLLM